MYSINSKFIINLHVTNKFEGAKGYRKVPSKNQTKYCETGKFSWKKKRRKECSTVLLYNLSYMAIDARQFAQR